MIKNLPESLSERRNLEKSSAAVHIVENSNKVVPQGIFSGDIAELGDFQNQQMLLLSWGAGPLYS